jgi:hypothetical protein
MLANSVLGTIAGELVPPEKGTKNPPLRCSAGPKEGMHAAKITQALLEGHVWTLAELVQKIDTLAVFSFSCFWQVFQRKENKNLCASRLRVHKHPAP